MAPTRSEQVAIKSEKPAIIKRARPQPSPFMKPCSNRRMGTPVTIRTDKRQTYLEEVLAIRKSSYRMTEKVRLPSSGASSSKAVTISRNAQMPKTVFEPIPERTSCIKDEGAWAEIMAQAEAEKRAREEELGESLKARRAMNGP